MTRTYQPSRVAPLSVFAVVLLLLFSMLGISTASANSSGESIASFDSSYVITEEGDVRVEEVITYNFGNEQKRGIVRTMPTTETIDGKTRPRTYEEFTVLLNGQPESFHQEQEGDPLRYYIGEESKTVSGQQQYVLRYTVTQPLFEDASGGVSFSWHATGGNWQVPINNVSATVSWEGEAPAPATFACASNNPCPITVDQENRTISYESATPLVATAIFPAESFPLAPFPEQEQVEAGERAIPGWMQDRLDHPNNPEMWRDHQESADIEMLGTVFKWLIIVIFGGAFLWGLGMLFLFWKDSRANKKRGPDSYSVTDTPSTSSGSSTSTKAAAKPEPKPQVDQNKILSSDLEPMLASLAEQGVVKVDEESRMVDRAGWDKTGMLSPEERTLLERSFNGRSSIPVDDFKRNATVARDSITGRSSDKIARQRSIYNSYESSGSDSGGYYNNPMTYLLIGMLLAQSSNNSSSSSSYSSSSSSSSSIYSGSSFGSSFGSSLSSGSNFSSDSFGGGGSADAGGGSW